MTIIIVVILLFFIAMALARDDGRYANSLLKPWFDQLASKKGNCCSYADGTRVEDVDWGVQDGGYQVRVWGEWVKVPESALITEPNRFGVPVVWPFRDNLGVIQIRCFMPGAGG